REMHSATGHVVEPWIAIETRLYQAIERHFKVRFSKSTGLALPYAPGEGPRESPHREPADVKPLASDDGEVGLDGRPLDADATVDDYVRPVASPRELTEGLSM